MQIPYIHEAKCSDVWGVCVSDQTHQLFASQLESKQFVQKTESSRNNATSPNSTHLQRYNEKRIIIYTKGLFLKTEPLATPNNRVQIF